MSDQAVRQAERRADSGSLDDAVRALTAKMRAGALTAQQVELAAYVGHDTARCALGLGPRDEADDPLDPARADLGPWINGLARFGDGTIGIRVGVAACLATWHALVPTHARQRPMHWRTRHAPASAAVLACPTCDGLSDPRLAIVAAQAWLACPCEWHAEAATHAGQSLGEDLRWWGMLAASVGGSKPSGARCARLCVEALATPKAEALMRAAIAADLARWALS